MIFTKALIPTLMLLLTTASLFVKAGTAEVQSGDGTTVVYEYGEQGIRMNIPGAAAYMLMRDSRVYMVSQVGGAPMVVDATEGMGAMGDMAVSGAPDMVSEEVLSLAATGRKEEVAGIAGEVYLLQYRTSDGREREAEVVLSNDSRAVAFRDAVLGVAEIMSNRMSNKQAASAGEGLLLELKKLNMGVLRYGGDMKVTSLSDSPVSAGRLALPAKPIDMSGLGGLLGTMPPTPGSPDKSATDR